MLFSNIRVIRRPSSLLALVSMTAAFSASACAPLDPGASGSAAQLVSQTRQTAGADVTLRNSPVGTIAQSFSLKEDGKIQRVQLKLYIEGTKPKAPSGYALSVAIEGNEKQGDEDRPSGKLVDPAASAKLDLDKLDVGPGKVYTFTFPVLFSLPKGGPYWIRLNADYPVLNRLAPFHVNWVGSNEATNPAGRVGETVYELLNQPGSYSDGLGANQAMYFVIGN